MAPSTINMSVIRLAAAIGAFLVMALILAIVLVALLRGTSLDTPQLTQLVTSIGVLLTLAVALVGASVTAGGVAQNTQAIDKVQTTVDAVHEQVNGHLAAHTELTADKIQSLINQAVQAALAQQAAPVAAPKEGES